MYNNQILTELMLYRASKGNTMVSISLNFSIEYAESTFTNGLYRFDKIYQSALRIGSKILGYKYAPFAPCPENIELEVYTKSINGVEDGVFQSSPSLNFSTGFAFDASDYRFGGWSGFELDQQGNIIGISDEGFAFKAKPILSEFGDIIGFDKPIFSSLKDESGALLSGKMFTDAEDITVLPNGQLAVSFERDHRVLVYDDILESATDTIELPQGMLDALDVFTQAYKETGIRQYGNVGIESLAVVDGKVLAVIEETLPGEAVHRVYMQNDMGSWDEMYYQGVSEYGVSSATTLPNGNVLFLERSTEYFSGYEHYDCRIVEINKQDLFLGNHFIGKELLHFDSSTADNFESILTYTNSAGELLVAVATDDNYAWSQRNLFLNFINALI